MLVAAALAAVLTAQPGIAAAPIAQGAAGPALLFLAGLKAGLLTFGGAYTAIPFVRDDAVGRGWLSDAQFLDGLALSGIIPAPLIIFATFVGYQASGLAGALAITAGIFLPAFAFTLLFFDRLERVIEDERLHRLLGGVAAGVVGLIAATTIELGAGVVRGAPSLAGVAAIFAAALALLYAWQSKLAVLAVILVVGGGRVFRLRLELDQHLAGVGAAEQAEEGFGRLPRAPRRTVSRDLTWPLAIQPPMSR